MDMISDLLQKAKELRRLASTLEATADDLRALGGGDAFTPAKKLSTAELCYVVLREAKQPLKKDEIFKRIQAKGVKAKLGSIQTYLSKDERLKNQGKGYWTLAQKPSESFFPATNGTVPATA